MADQRRRGGRGRSGRGGRIPRKGEGQGPGGGSRNDSFISFPLEVTGPIQVRSTIDQEAVAGLIRSTLNSDLALLRGLDTVLADGPDTVLGGVQSQIAAHRSSLEALARELDPDLNWSTSETDEDAPHVGLVAAQRSARLNWVALLRCAYASGDKRLDAVVKPVLREKDRHTDVIEQLAVRDISSRLFRDDDA